jgi:hypothetical protein
MAIESERTAAKLLSDAADLLVKRGRNYDSPQGERSMAKTVAAFNIISGHQITEADGWLFMETLKRVRSCTVGVHPDSLLDAISYAALRAECQLKDTGSSKGDYYYE